jgi:hypothetical protein
LIRNGPPSDSGAEIEITLSPFISINAPVILAVSVPATISGRCGPISNGPKEKPNSLARGCNAQRLTVSLDSAPRVTRSWHRPHRSAILSGSCTRASAKLGSTCSYW